MLAVALAVASPAAAAGPSLTINQAAGQRDPTSGQTVQFTATFSEPVTGFDGADVDLSASTVGGILIATVTGGPAVYTVSVSGMTNPAGNVVARIPFGAALNGASQPSQASTSTDASVAWTLDQTPPTVTIDAAAGQASPTSTAPVFFTVQFSEQVTGFGPASVLLSGSTTGGPLTASVAGGPTLYSVAVSGMTSAGTVVATIPAGAVTDLAGNPNTASTSTDNLVDWLPPAVPAAPDTTAPSTGTGTATGTASSPSPTTSSLPTPTTKPAPRCLVPKLTGKSPKAARATLKAADCKLGKVTKRPGAEPKSAKVTKQSPKPGTALPTRAAVKVTLG